MFTTRRGRALAALVIVSAAAFVLRTRAFTGAGGPLGAPSGYDDGVYFSTAALLVRGVLPYRDVLFVHPPGSLYVMSATAWWSDPAAAFAAARWLAGIIGAINVLLAGLVAHRAAGALAGIVAALLYAVYPDAVVAERSTYLEPVLNLAVLASALVWLDPRCTRRHAWIAGMLCGAGCAVKLWAGAWALAALASAPPGRWKTHGPRFLGGLAAAVLVLVAPAALPALPEFLEQVILLHVSRPTDGIPGAVARLLEMADAGHRGATVLSAVALLSIAATAVRRGMRAVGRTDRLAAAAMLLTVSGFLASSSYWSHYNSHLAASQCVLAGLGAVAVVTAVRLPRMAAVAGLALALAVLDGRAVSALLRAADARSGELILARESVSRLVPAGDPLFALDPTWGLVAGRLPEAGDGGPVVADSYAVMLQSALRSGRDVAGTGEAFAQAARQADVRARIARSRAVLVGWRGPWQFDDATRAWFTARFECRNPEAGQLCIWVPRPRPLDHGPPFDEEAIRFGEGWYDEESGPPSIWRWMDGRAVAQLPARRGPMRLRLAFEVPLRSLDAAPRVTIVLDGVVLDRFTATAANVRRSYAVDAGRDTPHVLVVTSDRTFNPARDGTSPDTRELALVLTSIAWEREPGT